MSDAKYELSHDVGPVPRALDLVYGPLVPRETSRLDDSLFSKDLAPHYMQLASKLASSELVPKSFRGKPQDLFICWAMGYQIGLSPEQSMQCIAIINGRPAMWGDDMLALCMAHKDFEDIDEQPIRDKNDVVVGYVCSAKRKGMSPKINTFTLEMAKKAGLLGKQGPWTQYPERMLKLRARGFTLRDAFPDALKGIKPREEVEDYHDGSYTTVHNPSVSRTELLKKDFLTKTGKLNEEISECPDAVQDQMPGREAEKNEEPSEITQDGEEKIDAYTEIKRLISERAVTEERISKALKYYESDSIEALSEEAALNFIEKLKLL